VLDLTAAFGGGTIGVLGTLAALELKKKEVKERSQCPYCSGSGQLTCATCLGGGTVMLAGRAGSSAGSKQSCPSCEGNGYITCVNCKGDGKVVPTMLDGTVSRDPESELEDIGMT
jgi:DnaJ-class molecular chaperone